ncbi:hypothetical protein [Paenibacillus nasutitermitis]|uniref:DUF8042 domain-containing protein n=1 Tax=Paenibacillus nasutitermitis TaxID=1652958 RepID=A0A916Z2E4_9BACL|nr:hypothetical protein [Paenibacillus nasutitermitis]GGD72741.1 hypothetical protein GCM10010911_33250 [Paenibacillus nasutitermitis]
MERYMDVMDKTLKLSETCLEAIAHIKAQLNEGQFEETSSLMSNVVEGFYHLEQALPDLLKQLPANNLEQLVQQLQQSLERVVTAYEQAKPGQVQEKLQFSLQPAFLALHRELEVVLRPYTLS